jgi:phenylacetate-CoA ligase
MYNSRLYILCPVFLQNIFVSLYCGFKLLIRQTADVDSVLEEVEANERSKSSLEIYSNKMLKSTLENAVNNSNYYREKILHIDFFDYIDKEIVKNNYQDLMSHNYHGVVFKGATSGTTGSPMQILQSKESILRERAFTNRHRKWAGFENGDKRAWIRGDMIVPLEQKNAPFWRFSYFENIIMLSSFHMTKAALPQYINAMTDYGVDVIQAYPSSIVILAKYLQSQNVFYSGNLKSILTSSETLSYEDRKLIEERFRCKVFDWYGLFERVAAIANCENGRYHLLTDYSYVEFIDAGDGRHEIVGTNYNNKLYPLIRYKTGDYVYFSDEKSCPCGRVFPIIDRIEGRIGDYLIGEDGQAIHILNHIPKGVAGLIATQFIQNNASTIEVQVVVDIALFDAHQKQILIDNTKTRLGQTMDVFVTVVDKIKKTKNGKTRQAICTVKDEK